MRDSAWAYPLLVVITVLAYWGAWDVGSVYDDRKVIEHNTLIRSWSGVSKLASPDYFRDSGDPRHYRPVATLSHLLVYQLAGADPRAHHAASLALHLINALLLLAFLRRVFGPGSPALLGALWFALHPALSEAVLCASFRRDALVLAAALGALACGGGARGLAGVALCQAIASGSKETAVVLVALLPITLHWLPRELSVAPGQPRRTALVTGLVTALYLAARFWLEAHSKVIVDQPAPLSAGERAVLLVVHLATYIKLLIWPWPLSVERLSVGLATPLTLTASLAFLTGLAALGTRVRADPRARTGLAWLLLPLIPVLAFIPGATAERYLYVPAAGGALLVALALATARARLPDPRWAVLAMLPVLAIQARIVSHQVEAWSEPLLLWRQAERYFPDSFRTRLGLAAELARAHQLEAAEAEVRRALKLYPESDAALHALAELLWRRSRLIESERAYLDLLARRPVDEARVRQELEHLRAEASVRGVHLNGGPHR